MSDYISREETLKAIQPRYAPAINKVLAGIIESVPAADAVPVVRCDKCMYCYEGHYENPGEPPYIKRRCTNKYAMAKSGYAVLADGFCSYGKRGDKNAAGDGDAIVADVKPVVRGHWIVKHFWGDAQCSECGRSFADAYDTDFFDHFCRHCGAEMAGVVQEVEK